MGPMPWTLVALLLASNVFSRAAGSPNDSDASLESSRIQNRTSHARTPSLLDVPDPLLHWESLDSRNEEGAIGQARTFGHKRIQFLLMPMMYKMGVMMTLLTVLTVISLKGLLIGATLLMLKLSTIIGKFAGGWHAAGPGWQSQSAHPIHLHVYGGGVGGGANPYHGHHESYPGFYPGSASDRLDEYDGEHYYYGG